MLQDRMISHSRPWITESDERAVMEVLQNRCLARGHLVEALEKEVASIAGVLVGRATGSGTQALQAGLAGMRVGPGDEVLMPTYVCRSVWGAVARTGATPVLCDIGEDYCIDPMFAARRMTKRTKALIVVHAFGIQAVMDSLYNLGVPVIEDCCHGIGNLPKIPVMKQGTAFAFVSMNATKMYCAGEGGLLLANSPNFLVSSQDEGDPAMAAAFGTSLSDLQAALGLNQLRRRQLILESRRRIADYYFTSLDGVVAGLPIFAKDRSLHFRFPIRTRLSHQVLREQFAKRGIAVRRGVDALLHRIVNEREREFPFAESAFEQTLSIPIYPALLTEEMDRVVHACKELLS